MTKTKPVFQVVPTTGDQEDLDASLTGEKILQYLWRELDLRNKQELALLWSRVCGAGFWKVCWDGTKGETFEVAATEDGRVLMDHVTGKPQTPGDVQDEEGNLPEGVKRHTVAVGDVHVEVIPPFEFFPDPLARHMDECEWAIHVAIKSPEYVRSRFGINLEPDTNVTPGPAEIRIPSTMERGGTEIKGIKLYEYWAKPSTDYPNGRHVVWAKEKILEQGDNPYKVLPFVKFDAIPVAGRFWPTSIVEQLRGPQAELNKLKSQIIENAQRIGNPAILKSRFANTQVQGLPGEIIEFDDSTQNAAPSYLAPPNMPNYVIEQVTRIEQAMQEISGQHEVSNAQVPPGVKAASAINLLQEADDTRLGPGIYSMEEALGEAGTMLLKIIAEYWTDERTVMIAGENHAVDVMSFKGAALKGNTHVEVQAGSAFPQSKAAKQAAIQDVLALAFQYEGQQPMNPRQLSRVMKDLGAGGLEKLFGDLSVDESQINRENQEMAQGEGVEIHPYDNHKVHIEAHQDYQKTAGYQALDPPTKKTFELHVQAHRIQVMKMLQPAPEHTEEVETTPPQPKGESGGSSQASGK